MGGRGYGGGVRGRLYTYRYTVTTWMTCIKMGSDESQFNVSVGSDGQSHKTVSTNHNLSEEKGEPKRYRTKVLPLTCLTPYRWAKPAHLFWFGDVPGTKALNSQTLHHTQQQQQQQQHCNAHRAPAVLSWPSCPLLPAARARHLLSLPASSLRL